MLQTLVGVVALEEEKKAEPKGLGKRDVGREGRKSCKMAALPTEVEKPEGEAGLGRRKGHLLWICGVEGLLAGLPSEESQLTVEMSGLELSRLLELHVVTGRHWPGSEKGGVRQGERAAG